MYCRLLEAKRSVHHELYHHFASFPECRQKDVLPSLLLKKTTGQDSHDWTEPVDVNCPGTQVNSPCEVSASPCRISCWRKTVIRE